MQQRRANGLLRDQLGRADTSDYTGIIQPYQTYMVWVFLIQSKEKTMGCDIHAYVEIKVGGNWHHYGPTKIRRDYNLFEYIAGVRGDNYEWEPRGLPTDVSIVTKLLSDHDGEDGHTHSWITYDEMMIVVKEFGGNQDDWEFKPFGIWFFGNGVNDWHDPSYQFPKEIEDVRIVFWFDN